MQSQWRDRARQLRSSVPTRAEKVSGRVRTRWEEVAPEVSRHVQEQIKSGAPVVGHRLRAARNAFMAPVPPLQQGPSRTNHSIADVVAQPAAPERRPDRPAVVRCAWFALVVAAAGSVVLAATGVYGLVELRDSVDQALHLDPTGALSRFLNDYVDDFQAVLMAGAVGLGIIFALAYLFVAYAVRRGHGWPRAVGTVLAVLSLPLVFLGPVAAVIVVAGIAAVVALWTSPARRYATQAKEAKRFRQRFN